MTNNHRHGRSPNSILLVDEYSEELEQYRRSLEQTFRLHTAVNSAEALEILKSNQDVAVIITGMKLPDIDGLHLLMQVKLRYPNIVRLMLTHADDQQTATDAINRGEIFRFLHKPCSAEQLATSINQALEHFNVLQVEHDMLRNTVRGSIKALTEVLTLVNPEAFGRTSRITNLTVQLAHSVGMKDVWFLESLAMLSQLGGVILPPDLLHLVYQGADLNDEQRQMVENHPEMGAEIVEKIPRMESVARAIRYQMKNFDGTGVPNDEVAGEKIPLGARILRVVTDFDRYVTNGASDEVAYQRITSHSNRYDPGIVRCLKKVVEAHEKSNVHELTVQDLKPGMVIMENVYTRAGIQVLNKGMVVSDTMLQRLKLFSQQQVIAEPIYVLPKKPDASS